MPSQRKHFIHDTVVEIGFRVEEGLPLLATPFMRLIIESYLARAQNLYPVTISGGIIMGNHVHLLIVVQDPEHVDDFVGYFKRETAHAINRLLGRDKHTVWCNGYYSPIVLDSEKVISLLVYFFTNPQSARLVNTIEEYPNFSTWSEFLSGGSVTREIATFPRYAIPTINPKEPWSREIQKRILSEILNEQSGTMRLIIEPFAWMRCFPDTIRLSPENIIAEVLKIVRAREAELRSQKGADVFGSKALQEQTIQKGFQPKKRAKRMICLATDKFRRIEYLGWFFREAELAKQKIKDWIEKSIPLTLPPGFFAPGGRMSANIFPYALQLS